MNEGGVSTDKTSMLLEQILTENVLHSSSLVTPKRTGLLCLLWKGVTPLCAGVRHRLIELTKLFVINNFRYFNLQH